MRNTLQVPARKVSYMHLCNKVTDKAYDDVAARLSEYQPVVKLDSNKKNALLARMGFFCLYHTRICRQALCSSLESVSQWSLCFVQVPLFLHQLEPITLSSTLQLPLGTAIHCKLWTNTYINIHILTYTYIQYTHTYTCALYNVNWHTQTCIHMSIQNIITGSEIHTYVQTSL